MYITINNIKSEKRIDLSYSIQNFDSGKEIAVIRMLSDNVKYEILKHHAVMDPISNTKKMVPIFMLPYLIMDLPIFMQAENYSPC